MKQNRRSDSVERKDEKPEQDRGHRGRASPAQPWLKRALRDTKAEGGCPERGQEARGALPPQRAPDGLHCLARRAQQGPTQFQLTTPHHTHPGQPWPAHEVRGTPDGLSQ